MEKVWILGVVLLAEFVLGLGYNGLVGYLEQTGMSRGYTAILVVAGVLVTLGGAALSIGVESALISLACFVASGLPMIVGSMYRHAKARQEEEELGRGLVKELLNGQEEIKRIHSTAGTNPGAQR